MITPFHRVAATLSRHCEKIDTNVRSRKEAMPTFRRRLDSILDRIIASGQAALRSKIPWPQLVERFYVALKHSDRLLGYTQPYDQKTTC